MKFAATRITPHPLIWILAPLALLGVIACAPDGANEGNEAVDSLRLESRPPVGPAPTIDTTVGMALPILAYQVRGESLDAVRRAERLLVARCMARFGFADPGAGFGERLIGSDAESRRYGIFDLTMAQQWGYHIPPGNATTQMATGPALSESELLVLTGSSTGNPDDASGGLTYGGAAIPDGGCLGEARRRISPNGDYGDADLVRQINHASFIQSASDDAVVDVIEVWSECMSDKGFDRVHPVDDPKFDPDHNPDWKGYGPTPTQPEISEAVADVECKRETNLVGVWFTVESAYQEAMIQKNISALTEIKKSNEAIVASASDIIASSGV